MTPTLVVDTSALVAIELDEPDAQWFADTLAASDDPVMSSGTLQELITVLGHRAGIPATMTLDFATEVTISILNQGVRIIPVDEGLAVLGAASTLRYRSAPTRFNYGDGFAYALALELDAAMLCKGDDFANADVPVMQSPGSN